MKKLFVFTAVVEADLDKFNEGRTEHNHVVTKDDVSGFLASTLESNLQFDDEMGCVVVETHAIELPIEIVEVTQDETNEPEEKKKG